MRLRVRAKMQPHAADEAGKFVSLGGMTNEVGGFVDDQQFRVLMDDVEKLVQDSLGTIITAGEGKVEQNSARAADGGVRAVADAGIDAAKL